jgi:DNA-binding transcriptional LysR family regulator
LSQPTLGRHIRELEVLAGETLFERMPGRMQPTKRAEDLVASIGALRDGILSIESALAGRAEKIAGTVRITTSEMFGTLALPKIIAPLLTETPGLQIEVQATDEVENIIRREADIAIRFFRPLQDDVITASLGEVEVGLFAHESFIATLPQLETPADLAGRHVGGADLERTLEIAEACGYPLMKTDFIFRSASGLAQLAAIEAGIGVGAMMSIFMHERPTIKRLFPEIVSVPISVWLCAHDDLRRSARIRRVFDHLTVEIRAMLGSRP